MNVSEKLLGLVQTNNRAEMTAVLYVLKMIPKWVTLQICTDSQLVVDTVLYWMEGWKRRGWKTKAGKPVENVDLWMEIQEALEERTAETFWVKVPSHVDIEGNEQADELAKKGVEKHGVKLKGEEIQAKEPGNRKRKMQEEQKEEEERWSRGCRKKFPEEKTEYMPSGKRKKQSSVQILLDLGPLLPVVIQRIPKRVLQITYVNLDRQLEDEGQRRQQVRLEEQMRAAVEVEFLRNLLDLNVRFENLQRWTLLVLDRRHRHALRVMGQVQWGRFTSGIGPYSRSHWRGTTYLTS